jgi:hypothetical protein
MLPEYRGRAQAAIFKPHLKHDFVDVDGVRVRCQVDDGPFLNRALLSESRHLQGGKGATRG